MKTASGIQRALHVQYEYSAIDSDALSVYLAGVSPCILPGSGGRGRKLRYGDGLILRFGETQGFKVFIGVKTWLSLLADLVMAVVTYPSLDADDKTLRNAKKAHKKFYMA